MKPTATAKIPWHGHVRSVQPRIRLLRSFDERSHLYLGYNLLIDGRIADEQRQFWVAIGKAAQAKHQLRVGDEVSGKGVAVGDPRMEAAELYKISALKLISRPGSDGTVTGPPWHSLAPELPTYRERGHRRLAAKTYDDKCLSCMWGCRMPVEMVIDHWNPRQRRYRFETWCYGPKSCTACRSGPKRKVPGRKGMSYTEEDWIDEDATAHRDD
jgi:hypothetical protein